MEAERRVHVGDRVKSLRQMARGAERILPSIMKTPRSKKLQLWTAPSVPPATTKRQQPANKHPLMNGKACIRGTGNVDGRTRGLSVAHEEARLHYQTVTASSCVICGLDRFRDWSPVTGGKWREWISRDFSDSSGGDEEKLGGAGEETTRWRVTET